tara:strand:+ start:67571 stop:67960 length:390 start_codon:yes stop_codon:yes gene_type:complete
MWEYLVKKVRPSRPQKEGTDFHASAPVRPSHSENPVELHSDTEIPGSTLSSTGKSRPEKKRYLHCPVCEEIMEIRQMGPVEIDVCPSCKGVFLDRGELQALTGYDLKTGQKLEDDSHYIIYTPKGLEDF